MSSLSKWWTLPIPQSQRPGDKAQNGGRALGKEASSQGSGGRELRASEKQRWGPRSGKEYLVRG